jgi:allantoicase
MMYVPGGSPPQPLVPPFEDDEQATTRPRAPRTAAPKNANRRRMCDLPMEGTASKVIRRDPSAASLSYHPRPDMSDFTELVDLAQERLGGAVIAANDEFFASKDNLLKAERPVFVEGKYTDRGKWMDGWETRRRRTPGHDFCVVRLGVAGVVRGVVVDTSFFKGNYPEACSIEACAVPGQPDPEQLLSPATPWTEILPRSPLQGDAENRFAIDAPTRVTHLRLSIHPDGGVARLRVFGDVCPAPRWLGRPGSASEVDLASVENGGMVVACNDMFFGSRHNLVMPGRARNMGDGWETKRSRRAGPDWVVVKLAAIGNLHRVEIDTNHFKGNYPESARLLVHHAAPGATTDDVAALPDSAWHEVLARTRLQPHTRHFYEREVHDHAPASHARFEIYPDGGVSRLRLWGMVSREGREQIGVRHLNALPLVDARHELLACCGSSEWAARMLARRPFRDLRHILEASDATWRALSAEHWLEAFRAHPRIGERKPARSDAPPAARWSEQEQAKALHADPKVLAELERGNREYEDRFGHIFIVCATGKHADEMLSMLRERMNNTKDAELPVAAEEQRKIMSLRLEKLVQR